MLRYAYHAITTSINGRDQGVNDQNLPLHEARVQNEPQRRLQILQNGRAPRPDPVQAPPVTVQLPLRAPRVKVLWGMGPIFAFYFVPRAEPASPYYRPLGCGLALSITTVLLERPQR